MLLRTRFVSHPLAVLLLGGACALLPAYAGCSSSDDAATTTPGGDTATHSLTADDPAPQPFAVVTLHDPAGHFAAKTYAAKLGSADVVLVRTSAQDLAFLVPDGVSGSVALKVAADGVTYAPVALSVAALPALPEAPAAYVASSLKNVRARLAPLASSKDADVVATQKAVAANLDALEKKIAALDAATVESLAHLMAANPAVFGPPTAISLLGHDLDKLLLDSARAMFWIGILGAGVATSGTGVGVVAAIGGAIGLAATLGPLREDVSELMHGILGGPVAAEQSSQYKIPGGQAPDIVVMYTPGQAVSVPLVGPMRFLDAADLGSAAPEVAQAAADVQQLAEDWAAVNGIFEPDLPALPGLSDATETGPVDATLVTVDAASVTNGVTLKAQSSTAQALSVTFDGKDGTDFTFEVTYDDGVFPKTTTTFSGKLGAGCKNASGGPAPAGRYEVVDPGTGHCAQNPQDLSGLDGSGQVKDTTTGLVWDRYPRGFIPGIHRAQADAFCQGQGARLPTKDEALAISGASHDSCAWPCPWITWTSTSAGAAAPGWGWWVNFDGNPGQGDPGTSSIGGVLCVR